MTLEHDLAVWVYGSHARGDADDFSYLDVLVVSETTDDFTSKRRKAAKPLL